jgi:NhaP-type Na+/H+ or K+/H+ antiporter
LLGCGKIGKIGKRYPKGPQLMPYDMIALMAGLVCVYAILAGGLEKTPFNGAVIYCAVGLGLGPIGAGWLRFEISANDLRLIAEMALALVLFVDAARADVSVLRRASKLPIRLILLALPLVIVLGWLAGILLLPGLLWIEVAVLAVLLAPTDAALGKAVVTNPSVPADLREGLNFESGLNDGVCVPIFLAFMALATHSAGQGFGELALELMIEEVGRGALIGTVIAAAGAFGLRSAQARGWISETWLQVPVAALAVASFAAAQALHGSGFIAAFVGGFVFGRIAKPYVHELTHASEGVGDTLALLTWVMFGAAVLPMVFQAFVWQHLVYALLSLSVVRILPVLVTLTGLELSLRDRLFVGWFGPRGLASVVFLVMVGNAGLPHGDEIISVGVLTITLSVLLHGITARPFANAMSPKT